MNGKDNFVFHISYLLMAKKLFILGIIITSVFSSTLILLNQNHVAMAQQQQQQQQLQQLQTNGNSFQLGNMTFSHNMASVNGIKLHYVIGGHGPPIVLLHGWPETWYAWHKVMPALAKNYTVIAPDLRGLGDSSKPTTGYDTKTVAEDIHQLVTKLGFKTIFLVGHDIGTLVSYPYAAAYPSEVKKLVVMESPIPGFLPPGRLPSWWNILNQVPDVPEFLVQGKEREYLSWFYQNEAYNSAAITQDAIDQYVSHYSAPGGMRAGFAYYKAIPQDTIQNLNFSKTKLTMPVLALGAGYHKYEGNVTLPLDIYSMKKLAQNVTGIILPNTGHWIPEEQPNFITNLFNNFFSGGNSTTKNNK